MWSKIKIKIWNSPVRNCFKIKITTEKDKIKFINQYDHYVGVAEPEICLRAHSYAYDRVSVSSRISHITCKIGIKY